MKKALPGFPKTLWVTWDEEGEYWLTAKKPEDHAEDGRLVRVASYNLNREGVIETSHVFVPK